MGQSNFKPRHRKNTGRAFNGRAAIDRMYDWHWEKYRIRFLKENPECYACGKRAEVVDHLIPHQGNALLFEKTDNHIPLCISCHNYVTTKFDRNAKSGVVSIAKIEWLNSRRVANPEWTPKKVKVLHAYRERS